jgi:hypothetical protein
MAGMERNGSATGNMIAAPGRADPSRLRSRVLTYQFAGFFSVTAVTGYQAVCSLKLTEGNFWGQVGGEAPLIPLRLIATLHYL